MKEYIEQRNLIVGITVIPEPKTLQEKEVTGL